MAPSEQMVPLADVNAIIREQVEREMARLRNPDVSAQTAPRVPRERIDAFLKSERPLTEFYVVNIWDPKIQNIGDFNMELVHLVEDRPIPADQGGGMTPALQVRTYGLFHQVGKDLREIHEPDGIRNFTAITFDVATANHVAITKDDVKKYKLAVSEKTGREHGLMEYVKPDTLYRLIDLREGFYTLDRAMAALGPWLEEATRFSQAGGRVWSAKKYQAWVGAHYEAQRQMRETTERAQAALRQATDFDVLSGNVLVGA